MSLHNNKMVGYFGYGSLVNRGTLKTKYVATIPAHLKGWRRHWQSRGIDIIHPSGEQVALLSVHRHADCVVSGMLIIDRLENLGEVDLREQAYDRLPVNSSDLELPDNGLEYSIPDELFVYVGKAKPEPEVRPKLLQSYLDTVMAGYMAEFGHSGLGHFLETTTGFDRAVIADRENPHYPRAARPEPGIAAMFDELLLAKGAWFA